MNKKQLREVIEEAFYEVLAEQAVLRTSAQETLAKFPTLRKTLIDLLTKEYDFFVKDIQWIAPKPTTFKILLENDQQMFLKWMGKGFEAEIAGKRYYLGKVDEFQQALDKLNEILKYASPGETEEPADDELGGDEFGGGDFGGGGFEGGGEEGPEGGEEEVEFEEPGEEPTEEPA